MPSSTSNTADMVPDAGMNELLWRILLGCRMIIVPTWNADASKEEVLTLLMAGAESYTAEGEDQPSEELSYSVSFFFRYRQLAQDFGKKLADMIDVWSRARSQPGVEALELFIREEWGKIDEQFTFEEDEVQIHVRCLIVCLCVAEIIAAALLLVIGDEKHNGLEPLRTMLTGVFLDAIIPEKLLPKEARRVMRTLRRQANKDLLESAYSPVGVLWQGFRGILRDNYVDDDPLKEAPQPVTSNGQDSHVKWSIPAPRESDVSVSHVRRHGSHLNDPSGSPSSRSLIFEDSQVRPSRLSIAPPSLPRSNPVISQASSRRVSTTSVIGPSYGRPIDESVANASQYYQPATSFGGQTGSHFEVTEPIKSGSVNASDRHKAVTIAKALPQISPKYQGLSDVRRFSWYKATVRKVLRSAAADPPTHWYYLQRSLDLSLFNQLRVEYFDPDDMESFVNAINEVWQQLEVICEGRYALQILLDQKSDLIQREDENVAEFTARTRQWLEEAELCGHTIYTYEMRMIVSRGLSDAYLSTWSADLSDDLSFVAFCALVVQKAASLKVLQKNTSSSSPSLFLNQSSSEAAGAGNRDSYQRRRRGKGRGTPPSWLFPAGYCQRCGEQGHYARSCPAGAPARVRERCEICGSLEHERDKCRFTLKNPCRRCGEEGHSEFVCPSRSCKGAAQVQTTQKDSASEASSSSGSPVTAGAMVLRLHSSTVTRASEQTCPLKSMDTPVDIKERLSALPQRPPVGSVPPLLVDLILYGTKVGYPVRALLDPGADVDLINHSFALRLQTLPLKRATYDAKIMLGDNSSAMALMFGSTIAASSTQQFTVSYWTVPDLPYDYIIGRESMLNLSASDIVPSSRCTEKKLVSLLHMFTASKKVEDYVTSLVPSEDCGGPSNALKTPDTSLKPPLWMDLKPEWELLDVVACEKEMALYYVRNGDTRFYAFDVSPAYVERVKLGNYRKEVRSHRKFNLASDTVRKEAINLLRDMVRVGKLAPVSAAPSSPSSDVRLLPEGLVSCTNTYPVGGENGKRVRPIFPFLALNRRTDCKSIKFHQSELRELLVSSRFYGICVYVDITDAFMTIRCSSRASSCLGLFCPEIGEDLDGDLPGWFQFDRTPYGYSPSPWALEQSVQHSVKEKGRGSRLALPCTDIKANITEGLSETPRVKNYMDDCHLMYGKSVVVLPANISEINVALVNYVRRSLACADMHLKDVKTVALSDGNVSSNGVFYATPYVISWPPSRWQAVVDSVVPDDITFRQALSFLGAVHVVDNWLLPPFFVMRRNLLQSLLQTQLHADGDDWDALVPHQSVEYLREFKNAFSDGHNQDYSVFRRVIQWAPLHVFVDSSTYSYGYIAGQYLEEVALGMDAADVSELRKILKSIKGPLQPRYDFSGKLFIPLWFEHALFSRIGHLTAHINTKELIAATSALVSAVLVIRGHHDAPIELYTDNSTCCKMLKHWKPTPLGNNVIDASQSLLQERLLNAVAVSVPDPVLKNVRYSLVPGSVNIADGLTRDALTESLMLALSTSSSVKTERQQQVRSAQGHPKAMLARSPTDSGCDEDVRSPEDLVLTSHPGILGCSLVSDWFVMSWRKLRILRAWCRVARQARGKPTTDGQFPNLTFKGWLTEKQSELEIAVSDNRFLCINGLWYQVTLYSPSGDLVPQLILPFSHDLKDLLRGLVWHVHECTAHACAGIVHTLIKSYCTWQGQKKFVHGLLKACDTCQRVARDRIQHYCGVRELITIPWYRVGLDVFGPIYRAKAYERLGKPPFNYILTYTCLYSGKTVIRPLHTRSGREIAQVHREVTADFGVIPIISVDCGSEFLSKEFLSVTVEDGSRVVYDAPNSPWSRAPLERRHATISKLLRVLAATKKTELWHTHLYKATRALNQSSLLRDGRMLSPDMLFFAYKPPVSSPLWMVSADQQARLVDLREQLRLRLVWDGEWMSNRESDRLLVDTRGKVPRDIPVVNDFVLVWSDPSGDKFRQAWRGPFRVLGFNAKGQVLLEGLKRPQAISNVKKYYQDMDAKNEATIEVAVASPKASSIGRDLQEADFFMMNDTLYQAADVDNNRAVCLGHPASICDDVIFIDDSVEEFDLINDDIQRLSGIRIGPGNQVTLNRSARKLMSEHN